MSAMGRLATDIVLGVAELDTLVRLGYEPEPPTITELDVIDEYRDAPLMPCEDCTTVDVAPMLHIVNESHYLCGACYWSEESAARQFVIDAGAWR